MRPRQEIIEIFSTFAQIESDRFSKWLTDNQLRRSIQNCLDTSVEAPATESFWALYWHKNWLSKSDGIAKMHLSAYLQEPCYWAAKKIVTKFTNNQYGLADYFQMGIAETKKILEDFNPDKCSNLKVYASIAFPSRLRDILRQRKEADICTQWGLLRKVSKKQLLEALNNAGFSPTQVAQYRLAWTCFKIVYVQNQPGGTHKLIEPNRQLWEAVADLYNREKQSQLTATSPQCNHSLIEKWLSETAICVRSYLYPNVASLDVPLLGEESNFTPDLPDLNSESLLAQMIAQEDAQNQQEQLSQMKAALLKALEQLDPQSRCIVKMYYAEGLTQQQIIHHLQVSQPTVSRRLVKARESLLAALIDWSQKTLNISVTSNLIKELSSALEEWLTVTDMRC